MYKGAGRSFGISLFFYINDRYGVPPGFEEVVMEKGPFLCAAGPCFPRGGSRASSFLRGLDHSSFPVGVKCLPLRSTLWVRGVPVEFFKEGETIMSASWYRGNGNVEESVPLRCVPLLSTGRKSSLLILAGSRTSLYSRRSQVPSAPIHSEG